MQVLNLEVGLYISQCELNKTNIVTFSSISENCFAPNAKLDLESLARDDREIEMFKRFNYCYEPPKNKPKVNLDVKSIVVTKKQPASNTSSPYFGEAGGSSLSNTPRLDEDIVYPDLNAFRPSSNPPMDRPATNRAQLDNFLHGIIGDHVDDDPKPDQKK